MAEPMKFEDLEYSPTHGEIEVQRGTAIWMVPVSVRMGRDMEAEGLQVYWIYAAAPAFAVNLGFGGAFLYLSRLFTWPSRWSGR